MAGGVGAGWWEVDWCTDRTGYGWMAEQAGWLAVEVEFEDVV